MRPDDPRHGSKAGYEAGCRDECCRRAQARYQNQWRMTGPRTVDLTGTRRRLEALQVLGWSLAEVSRMLGHERSYCGKSIASPTGRIQRRTAVAVAALYHRLCMTVPLDPAERPRGWNASRERTKQHALSKGYAPPLAWDNIDDPAERPRGMAEVGRIEPRKADEDCAECPRCGVRRQVRVSQRGDLCRDCRSVERRAS